MDTIKINSYAKLNLTLKIDKKLKNGYHNINSIFHQINLYDTIKIKKIKNNKIIIKSNIKKIQNKSNLAYKAASLLKNKHKIRQGIEINISKKIPMGAGLGGGSSNAAAMLMGLNNLFNLKLKKNELKELASKIGSDVPFFIEGKTCIVKGTGNKIKKVNSKEKLDFLIIKPKINISTRWAYNEFDRYNKKFQTIKKLNDKNVNSNKKLTYALKNNNIKKVAENLHNYFEQIIIKKYPIIKKIKNDLIKNDALNSLLSGSGSAVFGIFKNNKEAYKAYKNLRKKYNFVALSKSF